MAYAEKRGKGKDGKMRYRGRYKLPNGRYGSCTHDDAGQPFTTGRTAKEYAAGLEVDVRRKTFINPRDGRISLRAWSKTWLESIEVGPLSDRDYRSRLRAVILPEWGDIPVADITTIAVTAWEKRLRAQGYKDNSIRGLRGLLRTMLDDAVASKVIGSNPVPSRKGQRRGRYKPRPKTDERIIATSRQVLLVARNAAEVRGLWLFTLVLTSAYTGMRIAELAGLTRDRLVLDDDGTGARILLAYQQQYVGGKPVLIPAKYGSDRGLIIPPFLAALLRELIGSHKHERVFTGVRGGKLLIEGHFYSASWTPCVEGRPPVPASRGKRAKPGRRPVLGVEGLLPHGLRHSHKVWLDEGAHPKVAVEARMGHELPGVEGTYSHVTLGMELKIAASLQALWEDSLRPVTDRREFGPVPLPEDPSES